MNRSWLCRIGVHKWQEVGLLGYMEPVHLFRCPHCGGGLAAHIDHEERLTPAQVDAALPRVWHRRGPESATPAVRHG